MGCIVWQHDKKQTDSENAPHSQTILQCDKRQQQRTKARGTLFLDDKEQPFKIVNTKRDLMIQLVV